MLYFNQVIQFGLKRFVLASRSAGVGGFIIPDLPAEEASSLLELCNRYGLSLIFLVAPNSTRSRIRRICSMGNGFVYLVAYTGTTGRQDRISYNSLRPVIRFIRACTERPVYIGFGISSAQKAKSASHICDGIVVGSHFIKLLWRTGNSVRRVGLEINRMANSLNN